MDESINPILRYVREAREYGKIGNYSACLQSYSNAKDLIQQELSKCRSVNEHRIWNSLTSEIVNEELAVRRLRGAINDTIETLRNNDEKPHLIKCEEVASSKPDFTIVPKIIDFNPDPAPRRNNRRILNTKKSLMPKDETAYQQRQQSQSQFSTITGPDRSVSKK